MPHPESFCRVRQPPFWPLTLEGYTATGIEVTDEYSRIYDRQLEMCCPVFFTEESISKATAQGKMERLKGLMNGKESL